MSWNVKEYGASGDSKTLDTKAFQAAIDACYDAGGGEVLVPNGCYCLGLIELYSHVHLVLDKEARLLASFNLYDFDKGIRSTLNKVETPTFDACDYDGSPTKYFIYACHAEDIAITGEGTIDGNEELFYGTITPWHIDGSFYPRVPLIYFEDCRNVTLKDVTLTKSAFWTVHLVGCEHGLIDGLKIKNNLKLANCDGIDPDHCKHFLIQNCWIEAADDCIVFKATRQGKKYGACEDIIVQNCTLTSTSAAIKFGTETVSDIHHIAVRDCKIVGSNRGICLQLRDEGSLHHLTFQNIQIETKRFSPLHWWGKAEPIAITAVQRKEDSLLGSIYDIDFSHLEMDAENGIFIYGTRRNIYSIHMTDMNLLLKRKTAWPMDSHDIRPYYGNGLMLDDGCNVGYFYSCFDIELDRFKYQMDENMKSHIKEEFYLFDSNSLKMNKLDLFNHINDIHTTILGEERIRKNVNLYDQDVIQWTKDVILNPKSSILCCSKNYYVLLDCYKICINKSSYTIITAHTRK